MTATEWMERRRLWPFAVLGMLSFRICMTREVNTIAAILQMRKLRFQLAKESILL